MCAVFPELHKFLASVEKSGLIPPECNKNWLTLVCYLTSAARNSPVYLLGDSAGMSPGCDGRNESERTQTQTMVEGIYVFPPRPVNYIVREQTPCSILVRIRLQIFHLHDRNGHLDHQRCRINVNCWALNPYT
jgi:hypothetical protein